MSSRRPWICVGDVSEQSARVAVGGLGEGRLLVQWSLDENFLFPRLVRGSRAQRETDWTAQAELGGLPPGREIFVRALMGEQKAETRFRTASSSDERLVTFLWGGDVAGQGWGIDPARGGMLTFRSMLEEEPDFFIHCGDSIYADNPLEAEVTMEDGSLWRNLLNEEKQRVASEVSDFHGNLRYNFLDDHYRDFFQRTPVIAQWDDHEIHNDWNPSTDQKLADRGLRAFRDYWPMRTTAGRLYRKISYGPLVDVFVLDLRSYRGPNGLNRQTKEEEANLLLGQEQSAWFKQALADSQATWKIVAGEMPIATFNPKFGRDNWANGEGPPLGRELELADILSHIKEQKIQNVVWLSADVHYAMAAHFHPRRAKFKNFLPFWEFIAGPLHAGTFAPAGDLDSTFGPSEEFCAVPRGLKANRPPSEDLQFYGKVVASKMALEVSLHQRQGREIFHLRLPAVQV